MRARQAGRKDSGVAKGQTLKPVMTWALALGAGDGNRTRTISLGSCWPIPADPLDLAAVTRRYDISAPLRSLSG